MIEEGVFFLSNVLNASLCRSTLSSLLHLFVDYGATNVKEVKKPETETKRKKWGKGKERRNMQIAVSTPIHPGINPFSLSLSLIFFFLMEYLTHACTPIHLHSTVPCSFPILSIQLEQNTVFGQLFPCSFSWSSSTRVSFLLFFQNYQI